MNAMMQTPSDRPSEARERLLATATDLFYREGIHSVGVDRILADAGVTRATMYRHFAGKEALVVAYLEREDAQIRGYFDAAADPALSPDAVLSLVVEGIASDVETRHTRGCPFINASAEYPDADSEVRRLVSAHRSWFRTTLERVLGAAGVPEAALAAGSLVLLRDAALVGGYLDGAATVRDAFVHSAEAVVGRRLPRP